jgi:hypothetical protein
MAHVARAQVTDTDDPNYPDLSGGITDIVQAPGGVQLLADLPAKKIGVIYPVDSVVAGHANPTVRCPTGLITPMFPCYEKCSTKEQLSHLEIYMSK